MPLGYKGFVCLSLLVGTAFVRGGAEDIAPNLADVHSAITASPELERLNPDNAHRAAMFRGAASCAAAACHGGPIPGHSSEMSARGSEYSLWLERDPHANSWRTLCSNSSLQIMNRLGILKSGKIVKPDAYQNCLACHNSTIDLWSNSTTPLIAEGVGCESCHGPSRDWYDQHFRDGGARHGLQFPGSADFSGMAEIEGFVERARKCASCHVGGADRDMNHDIIAAGHPALYFDMASFHERYPKHWRSAQDESVDARARWWMAGQIAIAAAELELLQARVAQSHAVSTWPELSVFDCSSCHFELGSRARDVADSQRAVGNGGRARLRTWNLGGVEALAKMLPSDSSAELNAAVDRLAGLLGQSNVPRQSPSSGRGAVDRFADSLNQANAQRGAIELSTVEARKLFGKSLNTVASSNLSVWTRRKQADLAASLLDSSQARQNWESASRAYTAAWAALPPTPSPKYILPAGQDAETDRNFSKQLRQELAIVRSALLFPVNSQSPRFPVPTQLDQASSPQAWEAARVNAASILHARQP